VSAPGKKNVGLPPKRRMRHDRHFVDELAQRMGEGIGRMIRVTAITSNHDQPRTTLGDLDDLVASIAKHGVLEPLLVRRREDGYELVSGERRLHAAMQVGLTELPCIELEVDDHSALEIALVENLQRQDLTAFEEAEGFRTLVTKYGYTHEDVAEAVARSRVTVTEALKLLEIPPEIRELCRHADITAKGVLLEIAKAGDADAMRQLIQAIVEDELDRQEVRARRHEMAGAPASTNQPPEADPDQTPPPPARPFIVRFSIPDRPVNVSLSFRTPEQPDPEQVIAALEDVIARLRAEIASHD
jgi:ParB family transcriptional regulator, chromosome partitioning protein